MGLAVFANETVRPEEHSSVEQLHAISLGNTRDEIDVVFFREVHPNLDAWAIRHILRMFEGFLPAGKEIARVRELRQHDEVGT
ncbi:hypothetical protein D9M69_566180 [compost metagenome]